MSVTLSSRKSKPSLFRQADRKPRGSENRETVSECLLAIYKLAKRACEGHRMGWNEARVLNIETKSKYRK